MVTVTMFLLCFFKLLCTQLSIVFGWYLLLQNPLKQKRGFSDKQYIINQYLPLKR